MNKLGICITFFFTIVFIINLMSKYNFNDKYKNKNLEIHIFYTNWCGHSKNFLNNVWNKNLKYELEKKKIKYRLIDGDKNKEECKNRNISGFPTILLGSNNKFDEFTGRRDSSEILKHLENLN